MLQLSASEKLTGQCPQCGWCPPPQNAFRPNIMNEYVSDKGITVILSESDDRIESERGVFLRKRDDNGALIKRVPNAPVSGLPPQPPQQLMQQAPPPNQTIIPARPIPISLVKTPEEIAKTPKPVVAPVVEQVPTMSNPAAPAQTSPNMNSPAQDAINRMPGGTMTEPSKQP